MTSLDDFEQSRIESRHGGMPNGRKEGAQSITRIYKRRGREGGTKRVSIRQKVICLGIAICAKSNTKEMN